MHWQVAIPSGEAMIELLSKNFQMSEFSCLYALIFHYHKMLLMLYLRYQFPILLLGYLTRPPNIVFAVSGVFLGLVDPFEFKALLIFEYISWCFDAVGLPLRIWYHSWFFDWPLVACSRRLIRYFQSTQKFFCWLLLSCRNLC